MCVRERQREREMFCTALSSSVFGRFLACKCVDTPGLEQMPDVLDREKAAAEMFQLMPNGAFRSVATDISVIIMQTC